MAKRSPPIDTEPFREVMAEALRAYAIDDSYAVSMAKQANVILGKRAKWQLRLRYRALAGDSVPDPKGWTLADAIAQLEASRVETVS